VNQIQVGTFLVLRELGIGHEMETFEDRLSVQKAIYLAQAKGVGLGYFFRWYLRGPYARTLTQDVFEALQFYKIDKELEGHRLDATTRDRLANLLPHLKPPTELPQWSWLELLASLHFLFDTKQAAGRDSESLRRQLEGFEKPYTTEQVTHALDTLHKSGLLPS
jgi:hypothetical protein